MTDLTTEYMGTTLSNPIVPSASPLSHEIENIRQMEDAGAAAVVLWSLFAEQLSHEADELEHYLHYGADRFAESLSYFPQEPQYTLGPEEYLDHIAKAKKAVDIPIIASLNAVSCGQWTQYAKQIQQAGADAIELNLYYIPTNPQLTAQQVEDVYIDALKSVKSVTSVPVAMKLSPFFSSMAGMAQRLDETGADALVLFNRFYQPDIDIENLEVAPNLILSSPDENRLPMRWIAILHGRINASLAATTGIHSSEDVTKMIMAGADVTMMCSALLKNGIEYIKEIKDGLIEIMQRKEYESLSQLKGILSQKSCPEPAAFERANYMKTLQSYGKTATLE